MTDADTAPSLHIPMSTDNESRLIEIRLMQQWARVGALFNVAPATESVDLELLVIETARVARGVWGTAGCARGTPR